MIEDSVAYAKKCIINFQSLSFIQYCISIVNFIIFYKVPNGDKRLKYFFANISHEVLNRVTKIVIKTQLIREERIITNRVEDVKGQICPNKIVGGSKLNQILPSS